MALDQVAANLRQAVERADFPAIELTGPPRAKVPEEGRPDILARPKENRVGMPGRLFWQRRDMQSAQADVRPPAAVMIGYFVRTFCGCDVNLDDNQIRLIIQIESLHVFVLQSDVVIIFNISRESGEPQRRKQ